MSGSGYDGRSMTDPRHKTLYLPTELLDEVRRESERLDRSVCATFQLAWRLAKDAIHQLPSAPPSGGRHRHQSLAEIDRKSIV